MRTFLGVCLAPLVLGCSPTPRRPAAAVAPRAFFRFHADLWPNLHEVLLHEALLPRPGFAGPTSLAHQTVAPVADLSGEEAAAWHDAVGYYDAHFATDDLFTVALESATRGLSAAGSGPLVPAKAGVPDEWRAVLTRAEPVYRAHFWTEHERGDRAYIAAIEPLVAPHAAWFAERLARIYDTPGPAERPPSPSWSRSPRSSLRSER